jgi:serine protease Do
MENKNNETQEVIEKSTYKESPRNKSSKLWFIVIFLAILFSFLGASVGFVASEFLESHIVTNNETVIQRESAVIDVVEKNSPAVVSILVTKDVPKFRSSFDNPNFFDFFFDSYNQNRRDDESETEKQEVGGGSGFLVAEDGLIVTNKHVVEDQDAEYTVITKDEKEYKATVLARHPVLDIAVIKIESEEAMPTLELGDSDNLKVGQSVVAIGNSLGEFSNSVSLGIVSGLQRNITASSGFGQSERLNNIIQTDAAINPGNSGGPLLDIQGKVVGVNVAVVSGAQSIGFALPVEQIKNIVNQVEEGGEFQVPFLGIRYVPIDEGIQESNNLPYDYGVLIIRGEKITDLAVVPGSPADKAGLVENDIVLEIEGEKITEDNPLAAAIAEYDIEEEIELKIWHKGEEKEVDVLLEEIK